MPIVPAKMSHPAVTLDEWVPNIARVAIAVDREKRSLSETRLALDCSRTVAAVQMQPGETGTPWRRTAGTIWISWRRGDEVESLEIGHSFGKPSGSPVPIVGTFFHRRRWTSTTSARSATKSRDLFTSLEPKRYKQR